MGSVSIGDVKAFKGVVPRLAIFLQGDVKDLSVYTHIERLKNHILKPQDFNISEAG